MPYPVISGRGRDDNFRHLAPSGDIGIDRPGDLNPFDAETGIQAVEEVVRTVGNAQQELAVVGRCWRPRPTDRKAIWSHGTSTTPAA